MFNPVCSNCYVEFQKENVVLGLSVALFLCSGRESCFHFVNGGGLEQVTHFFLHEKLNSTAITLLLLGVVEQATRFSIGCEGFFGWWPREDENVPSGISEGYSQLLKLLLQKPRHDVASLASYVLHRLRFYEVASRYEVCMEFCLLIQFVYGCPELLYWYLVVISFFFSVPCYLFWEVLLLVVGLLMLP